MWSLLRAASPPAERCRGFSDVVNTSDRRILSSVVSYVKGKLQLKSRPHHAESVSKNCYFNNLYQN